MKSGENGLIGPGSNDYGRKDAPPLVREFTPELSEKLFKQITQRIYDKQVSKRHVLHHLKQLKAQMGKAKKDKTKHKYSVDAISLCMEMIDKKIAKIEN